MLLETAGTIDRDVEIKFQLGGASYSIDIEKSQIEKSVIYIKPYLVLAKHAKKLKDK